MLYDTTQREQRLQTAFTTYTNKTMEKTISMRLSEEDNLYIEAEAKKERLSKSSWIRRKIFLGNK